KSRYFGSVGASSDGGEGAGTSADDAGNSLESVSGAGSEETAGGASCSGSAWFGRATSTGGVIAPIRFRIICWRRNNRGVGCAGLSRRGLIIAAASSADEGGVSADADWPK